MATQDFKQASHANSHFDVYRALQDVRVITPAATKTVGGVVTDIFPDNLPKLEQCLPLHQQIAQQKADLFAQYSEEASVNKALDTFDEALDRLYLMSTNAQHIDHKESYLKRDQAVLNYFVEALDKSEFSNERLVQAVKMQCETYAPELIIDDLSKPIVAINDTFDPA